KKFGPETMEWLQRYHWPGNVRELQHSVERAVIMSDGEWIATDDFPFPMSMRRQESADAAAPEPQNANLEEVEREVIRNVLSKHGGNISHAAKELGLTRASLYRRLEKHGL